MTNCIRIEGGGEFSVPDSSDSLLRGALRAGQGFPHECGVGGCGACRFELVEGEMETLWAEAPGLGERDRRRGKRLACQSRPLGDCTVRVRCGDEYRPRVEPRRRQAILSARRMLTADMAEIELRTEGPADFLPGQYALFDLPGVAGARAYSMSNLPNGEGVWQFIVRRTPVGRGSRLLVDELAPGTAVAIDGPYGGAWFRADVPRPVVCIAGGSGLAPMLSVARAAAATDVEVDFFFGARTRADLCAEEALAALPGFGTRLRLHPVLSEEVRADWTGARGFVHEEVRRRLGASLPEREIYFAGPPAMADAVQTLLMVECRVPYGQVHFDRFV